MTVIVWIFIQYHEAILAAMQDEHFSIVFGREHLTKETSARLIAEVLNELHPPWRPKILHLFALVDAFAQFLSNFEERNLALADIDRHASLRISAEPRPAVADLEAAESADLDAVIFRKRLCHAVEDRVDDDLNIAPGQVRKFPCQHLDQITLVHKNPPFDYISATAIGCQNFHVIARPLNIPSASSNIL